MAGRFQNFKILGLRRPLNLSLRACTYESNLTEGECDSSRRLFTNLDSRGRKEAHISCAKSNRLVTDLHRQRISVLKIDPSPPAPKMILSCSLRETITRRRSLYFRKAKLEVPVKFEGPDRQNLVRSTAVKVIFSEEDLWQKRKMPHQVA